MESWVIPVSASNSSVDLELYIFHSTIKKISDISEKVVLVIYSIIVLLSIIQTFWKNKPIDRLLASMMKAYSDGKFQSVRVCFHEQTMTCYQFDQRFSHIPPPKRSILLIFSTHIQVLLLIILRTLFTRRNEQIKDCYAFHRPYEVLQCEDKRDPCQFNDTETAPKCAYYHFELTNFIAMVTSIITWHYALRYLIVKLVRLVRWILFRDNDKPRRFCCCCCQLTPCLLRCLMYLQYIGLWLYLSFVVITALVWNLSMFRISLDLLGSPWMPVFIAIDRLGTLSIAFSPELMQNWLDATSNGNTLLDLESKELILNNVEPLVYLIKQEPSSNND